MLVVGNLGGKKIAWQLRHHIFMFRSFVTWLKSRLIVRTSCLLKVFFGSNRTTYRWWYWFPFLCDFFTSCYGLHRNALVTRDVGVSSSRDIGWEAPKFTCSIKGFMLWHSFGCSISNWAVSLQRFLNPGNLWKPRKTQKHGDWETHGPFSGNLMGG